MKEKLKRAAGAAEKEERRRAILDKAESLFRMSDFDRITMSGLAESLGLAKGTLYLYFPTKESLFLALLGDLLDESFQYVARIGAGKEMRDPDKDESAVDAIAGVIAAGISADPVLPRLLSMLHAVLERNSPYDEALAFKKRLASAVSEAGKGIARALSPMSEADGVRFLLYVYAQVVGLVGQSDLSPFMRKVCAEPGLGLFKLGFKEALFESIRDMLAGMVTTARERARRGRT